MQIYAIDFTNSENEKYSLNKFNEIFQKENTKPYAIVLNPETCKKMTLTINKPTCCGATEFLIKDPPLLGYLVDTSDKIIEDVAKVAYDAAELQQIKKYGASFAEIEQKELLPAPMAIAMMRIEKSKLQKSFPAYVADAMNKMSESLVIDRDFLFRKSIQNATEAMHRFRNECLDALCYTHISKQQFEAAAKESKPRPGLLIMDEVDTYPSTGYLLEQRLKVAKGKVRRKIRRYLKKWKKGKYLLGNIL